MLAARTLTWDQLSNTMYRWRRNMELPLIASYRAVRTAILLTEEWRLLARLEHAVVTARIIDTPMRATGLLLTDLTLLRRCPITALYFGSSNRLGPTLAGTQYVISIIGKVSGRVSLIAPEELSSLTMRASFGWLSQGNVRLDTGSGRPWFGR